MKNQRGSLQKKISKHGSHPGMTNADHTIYFSFSLVKFRQNVKIKKKKEIFYCNIPIFTEKISKI
jgi:hypothetical protein